jgi:hypothetical protein
MSAMATVARISFAFIFSPHLSIGVRVVWMLAETVLKQFFETVSAWGSGFGLINA